MFDGAPMDSPVRRIPIVERPWQFMVSNAIQWLNINTAVVI
jgi:hypothetical protein